MDLQDYREQIDRIDDELLQLFKERMDVSRRIAMYKKENGLPVRYAVREKKKLAEVEENAGEEIRSYANTLFSTLFELSREYQGSILNR